MSSPTTADVAAAKNSKAAAASKSKVSAVPAAAPARSFRHGDGRAATIISRGSGSATAFIGHGNVVAPAPNTASPSNGVTTAASGLPQSMADGFDSSPIHGRRGYPGAPNSSNGTAAADFSMGGFGAVGSSHGRGGSISPISPPFGRHPSWDAAWDNQSHPPGGFMSFVNNQSHLSQNLHFVGAPSHYAPFKAPRSIDVEGSFAQMDAPLPNNGGSSPPDVEILLDQQAVVVDSDNENVRIEKRIMWTPDEDERLMSAWIENSTDSSTGADRKNDHYWGDVIKSYNITTPSHRKRNSKQAKDRWHKINRWTDLFECAYVKARRVFTCGYSDQMWIEAAHRFYLEDNKNAKLGPFVLMNVWKICRDVAKWKTYNEELRNARKRKSYHLEEEGEENDEIVEEMPKRPIGQKAAKRVALAAKGKSKAMDDDGNSKHSAIDVDKLDKFSKIQEEANANRMKVLELQQKLSSEKIESTRLAHLTAQENKEAKKLEKESKMMEAYNTLISRDTSSMSDDEKSEHLVAKKCFRNMLFPGSI